MSLFDLSLPRGGEWGRLGDFYEVTRKPRTLKLPPDADVSFVPMAAVPQGGHYLPRYETRGFGALSSGTYFERGDVLVAKITPSFENGKQALVSNLPDEFGYATTEVIPLRPHVPGHDSRFLFFYLLHPEVREHVADRMEGSTGRQRVPEAVLMHLPYPIFSDHEQRAIADVLERANRLADIQTATATSATALYSAAMRELFSHGLSDEEQLESEAGLVPKSWRVEHLGAHCSVVSGGTPSRANPQYWADGTIPWVKTTEVNYATIVATEEKITESGLAESSAKLLPAGTLLLAMYGQGVTRGKVARLGIEATCNQACAAIRPNGEDLSTAYLYHYLSFRYEAIRQMAHGGQQQNLNLDLVRSIAVAFPPERSEQDRVVAVLDAVSRKIALHRTAQTTSKQLFAALLHNLVTGDLATDSLDLTALASEGHAA